MHVVHNSYPGYHSISRLDRWHFVRTMRSSHELQLTNHFSFQELLIYGIHYLPLLSLNPTTYQLKTGLNTTQLAPMELLQQVVPYISLHCCILREESKRNSNLDSEVSSSLELVNIFVSIQQFPFNFVAPRWAPNFVLLREESKENSNLDIFQTIISITSLYKFISLYVCA